MGKNRIHPIQSGKTKRMSFGTEKEVFAMPNLVAVQRESFDWFLKEGLKEVFEDSSIEAEIRGREKLYVEFSDFSIDEKEARYSIETCKERDITYAAPLNVTVGIKKTSMDSGEVAPFAEKKVVMCDLPMMTDNGSFVINGAERVIVSQIVRSPGCYFTRELNEFNVPEYHTQIIPGRGNWLEYNIDDKNVMWVSIDHAAKNVKNKKIPFTWLLRALNYNRTADGLDIMDVEDVFGGKLNGFVDPVYKATVDKEGSVRPKKINREKAPSTLDERAAEDLYSTFHPDEDITETAVLSYLPNMLFVEAKYDLANVGRYKFNKKLDFAKRIQGQKVAEGFKYINADGKEVTVKKDSIISETAAEEIRDAGVQMIKIWVNSIDKDGEKVPYILISNQMVNMSAYLAKRGVSKDMIASFCPEEPVYYPALMRLLEEDKKGSDLANLVFRNMRALRPHVLQYEEIFATFNYALGLKYGLGNIDDIDHLANRRIRAVGELLQQQFRVGMARICKAASEKLSTKGDEAQISDIINVKPLQAAIKEFFGSSQLSQFMDQSNPLSEITHKRRLSALGTGGLSRERATFEVRDIHYTHYGRMCPVETPEGPNIGLITSLAMYAHVNKYGFIEAPYRVVDKKDPKHPHVTNRIEYLDAEEEDKFTIAQANTPLDENGYFTTKRVTGRHKDEIAEYDVSEVDYMDVSPKEVFSVATAMIPFLANDDANRALMGSNMQRQAVPLMLTETSAVDTGLANKAAVDSGVCVLAKRAGTVSISASNKIVIIPDEAEDETDEYKLMKFERSNSSNSYNQKPIVFKDEHVEAGQIIADGPSTCNGEIALGKNPLIGFMTWEGYNYEDAVLISERLVHEDVYTSIHIEEYSIEERDTKLGPEQITYEIPSISQEERNSIYPNGIIPIGAEVRAGDILVGKLTPKGEPDSTPEENLLRAVLEKNASETRDTSLRLPHGAYGTVVNVRVFDRETDKELQPNVLRKVVVYVAQKRKLSVGDKMAGRHGNKGVVSRILPVEDMPFLPNGRPLDIVLNPLGVPSRMNIGQVLEMHLSLAAKILGFNITTPIFDGATEKDIKDLLLVANDYANMENFKDFKEKYKDTLSKEIMTYLGDHLEQREIWKGVPIREDGKVTLRDGRTGEEFDAPVTIGHMNYLKLHHLVDDKIHARAIGPYSLVTQQPLGGKAQFGGQRFGEMEVWALEAYGASHTLQEVLTVKSDDITGRTETYKAIVKGDPLPVPGIPESFKVLMKELQALGLDIEALDENRNSITIEGKIEDEQKAFNNTLYANDLNANAVADEDLAPATDADGFHVDDPNAPEKVEEDTEENNDGSEE